MCPPVTRWFLEFRLPEPPSYPLWPETQRWIGVSRTLERKRSMGCWNPTTPMCSSVRRLPDFLGGLIPGMTEAALRARKLASRCSRRRSLRYFSGRIVWRALNARTTGTPLSTCASSRRELKEPSRGFWPTTARSLPSFTWSSALSPSPPSQPCSVVKWGLVALVFAFSTVERSPRGFLR